MAALIIESTNSKNLKLIAELAKQLGSRVKSVSDKDLIDFEFESFYSLILPGTITFIIMLVIFWSKGWFCLLKKSKNFADKSHQD